MTCTKRAAIVAAALLLPAVMMHGHAGDFSPGDVFRDCPECPELVVVPAGSFMMGAPATEEGSSDSERPVHPVRIPRPFAVGIYEVTFAEWDACLAAGGCGGIQLDDRAWGRDRRPAVGVHWKQAQSYVEWLSGRTGEQYRLLSEAEWEYVARAGSTTAYTWGDGIGCRQASYGRDTYSGFQCGAFWGTMPAGSFAANQFGLYDVHGNLWELVQDCWNENYEGAPADGSAWESGDCAYRVMRGGAWTNNSTFLRSATRIAHSPDFEYDYYGFRVHRTLVEQQAGE